jgi:NAD-dependent deacetylase sirtuin 2
LYANLQKYNLPYPEAIFDLHYFLRRPGAFYELSRELFPGKYKPTACHNFIKLLADRGMLKRNYTQNIDMLERLAGIPENLIIESHGSFHKAKCVGRAVPKVESSPNSTKDSQSSKEKTNIESDDSESDASDDDYEFIQGCNMNYTIEEFKKRVFESDIPRCVCNGFIKPNITFFRERLPDHYFSSIDHDFPTCDALIVIGTSLKVHPFASLVDEVSSKVPRLLINREIVGDFDFDYESENGSKFKRDALFLGDCDEGVNELIKHLGLEARVEDLLSQMESLKME